MGGGSSLYFQMETPEEIQERSRIIRLQDQALDYVTHVLYYGVAIRTGRKPSTKIDQIWIEPQPDLLEEALKNGDATNLVRKLRFICVLIIHSVGSTQLCSIRCTY